MKNNRNHPLYGLWCRIKQRCGDPNNPAYRFYGAKGVRVCERWKASFEDFADDMGKKPSPIYSIDRINPEGDYCPDNVRWATPMQQAHNKRIPRPMHPSRRKYVHAHSAMVAALLSTKPLTFKISAVFKCVLAAEATKLPDVSAQLRSLFIALVKSDTCTDTCTD